MAFRIDGVQLEQGSRFVNAAIDTGAVFPSSPEQGEIFYKTGSGQGLYVNTDGTGAGWVLLLEEGSPVIVDLVVDVDVLDPTATFPEWTFANANILRVGRDPLDLTNPGPLGTIKGALGGATSGDGGQLTVSSGDAVALGEDGGLLRIQGGVGVGLGTGGALQLLSGAGGATGNSGAITIQSPTAAAGTSGNITVSTSSSQSTGAVNISTGVATSANAGGIQIDAGGAVVGAGGAITVNAGDGVTGGLISFSGGDSTGGGGESAGSFSVGAGQKTSGVGAAGSVALTAGLHAGTTGNAGGVTLTAGAITGTSAGAAGNVFITAGASGATAGSTPGAVTVTAGSSPGDQTGGAISLQAGGGAGATNSGGAVNLTAGNSVNATGGGVVINTGSGFAGAHGTIRLRINSVDRLEINAAGAFLVSGSAGTLGQVLTSGGVGAQPTWASTGSGSVTSVDITPPAAGITASGGPITTSGSITLALANDLAAVEGLSTTGIAVRTGVDTWATRFLVPPPEGFTILDAPGLAGNPTFVLADDLAAVEALGTTGLTARTGTSIWAARTLVAPAAGLTITNPGGVAGNPTFALADDLLALESLLGFGILVRDAANSYVLRSITGVANQITLTNGDGVAAAPAVGISTNPIIPGSSAMVVPVGTTAQRATTTEGAIRFNSDNSVFEGYVQDGWRDIRDAARVAVAADINTSLLTPGATINGRTMVVGDRVLLNFQTVRADNGVWVWNGPVTPLTRATDFNTADEFNGRWVYVENNSLAQAVYWVWLAGTTLGTDVVQVLPAHMFTTIWRLSQASGVGFPARTSTADYTSWSMRTITGAASQITVTDGDGVAGNPTVGFATNPIIPGTGALTLPVGTTAQRPGSPTVGMIRYNTTNSRVESFVLGSWRDNLDVAHVRVGATFSNVSVLAPGATLNGVSMVSGDRVLLGFQTAELENGVWVWNGAAVPMTRATDFDTAAEMNGRPVFIEESVTVSNGNTVWIVYIDPAGVVGVNDVSVRPMFLSKTLHGLTTTFSGTGFAARTNASNYTTWTARSILGTSDQISVVNGSGVGGDPTLSISSNPIIPGTARIQVPVGTTGQRPGTPLAGDTRYNSTDTVFEYYNGSTWVQLFGTASVVEPVDQIVYGTGVDVDSSPRFKFTPATGIIANSAGDFAVAGDAQTKQFVSRIQTTNATLTEMFLDGASGTQRMTIPTDTTWFFRIEIAARRTDVNGESAAYRYEGCIDNNAGTTAMVGTMVETLFAEDDVDWAITVTADDTNDALRIQVTGEPGKTIRWVAHIRTVEVTG